MHPKTFFDSAKITTEMRKCFVLMPFNDAFDEIYDIIRETIESPDVNFDCQRADDIQGGGHIMESVLQGIGESEIIIADLTGRNPNVFYELGIAHTIKKVNKVILLIQKTETIPFDLNPFRCIVYEQSITGAKKLRTDLANAVCEVADVIKLRGENNTSIYQFRVKNQTTYKFPVKLIGENNLLYDFEIIGDYIGDDGMKCGLVLTEYAAGSPPKQLGWEGLGMLIGGKIKVAKIPWNLQLEALEGNTATFRLIRE